MRLTIVRPTSDDAKRRARPRAFAPAGAGCKHRVERPPQAIAVELGVGDDDRRAALGEDRRVRGLVIVGCVRDRGRGSTGVPVAASSASVDAPARAITTSAAA